MRQRTGRAAATVLHQRQDENIPGRWHRGPQGQGGNENAEQREPSKPQSEGKERMVQKGNLSEDRGTTS